MRPYTLTLLLLTACSGIDPKAEVQVKGPDFGTDGDDFRLVSAVIERRCGTLDCHGAIQRPLRIYGQYGLRRPEDAPEAGAYPGGLLPTTVAELTDNYQSIISQEPEIMVRLVAGKAEPEELTFVRKPRLLEKHKGGLVWNKGDDGDTCVVSWLTGMSDTESCNRELMHR